MQKSLPVDDLVSRLCRKERDLKNAGAFAEAAGVRDAVVVALRMADEEVQSPPPIEPTE